MIYFNGEETIISITSVVLEKESWRIYGNAWHMTCSGDVLSPPPPPPHTHTLPHLNLDMMEAGRAVIRQGNCQWSDVFPRSAPRTGWVRPSSSFLALPCRPPSSSQDVGSSPPPRPLHFRLSLPWTDRIGRCFLWRNEAAQLMTGFSSSFWCTF